MNDDLTKKQIKTIEKLKKRIVGFKKLENNWDDEGAKVITSKAINRALILVDEIYPFDLEQLSIFPTRCGGVQFEWFGIPDVNPLIEILPTGKLYIKIVS